MGAVGSLFDMSTGASSNKGEDNPYSIAKEGLAGVGAKALRRIGGALHYSPRQHVLELWVF